MTIGIALICDNGETIYCGADRRVTKPGLGYRYDPAQPKISKLTDNIAVVIGGDMAIQGELIASVLDWLGDNTGASVKDVAYTYSERFHMLRVKRAAIKFGPAATSATQGIKEENRSQIAAELLYKDLQEHRLDSNPIETIFAGRDSAGCHVYVVIDGDVKCTDIEGFATIGIGSNLAESQFVYSNYGKATQPGKALYVLWAAKKRSERKGPDVGDHTDVFVIDSKGCRPVSDSLKNKIEKRYNRHDKAMIRIWRSIEGDTAKFTAGSNVD